MRNIIPHSAIRVPHYNPLMLLAELTWQSLRWLPIAVVAAALGIGGTWWLYAVQLRLRSRAVRWGLPLLRSIALLALAIALVKPVVLRAMTNGDRGVIVVLVDRSASMNVVDNARPAQLLALADGLKLLPADAAPLAPAITQEDVDQLRAQADRITRAASELEYARLANRGVATAQARLDESIAQLTALVQPIIARGKDKPKQARGTERLNGLIAPAKERPVWIRELGSRVEKLAALAVESENVSAEQLLNGSPEVRAICYRISRLSRVELAKLAIKQSLGPEHGAIDMYGFAASVAPMALEGDAFHDATANPTSKPAAPATQPIDPDQCASDLTGAIRTVLQNYPAGGVAGVVLVSDGQQVGSELSVESLAAAAGDVPVYTVRMARPGTPRDVAVAKVAVPPRGFVGETLNVRVDLRASGIKGSCPVTVTIGTVTQTKPANFNEGGSASVEFSTKLDQAGPLRVGVTAAAQPGEITLTNNAVERWVNVLSDKVHAVAIAQSAGRDFQFLRDALSRTAWMKLDEVIAASPDARATVTNEQLSTADVVILEDAGPNLVAPEQWQQVRKLVADRGAGAILLAGTAHRPGDLLVLPDAAELLPIAQPDAAKWRSWGGEWPTLRPIPADVSIANNGNAFSRGTHATSSDASDNAAWPPRLNGDSSSSDARLPEALRLTDDLDSSLRKWQELPPMFRLMNLAPLKPNASPLLIDADTRAAVATQSRLGAGRVAFIGMNETWRWRYKVGQRDQERFWLQLVRQVADEPYAATAGGVSIDADRLTTEPGKPLKLRARVRDTEGKPSALPTVQLTVKASDGSTRVETLPATAEGSGRYEKTVNGWPTGAYELSTGNAAEPKITVRIAATPEAEMANLSGDERLMRRLAEATGGQSIGPEHLADLPADLASSAAQRPRIAEVRLWDSPYLYALVLACFGLEWAVRKQAGLA